MFKNGFTCLLILLIVLQSVMVLADEHQPHQSDSQHQEFDHSHKHPDIHPQFTRGETTQHAASSTDDFDCHHCCHCHSVQLGTSSIASAHLLFSSPQLIAGQNDSIPAVPQPVLFRPPIS